MSVCEFDDAVFVVVSSSGMFVTWVDVVSWTSAQLGSFQELFAGLLPVELLAIIPLHMNRGLKICAITAMS